MYRRVAPPGRRSGVLQPRRPALQIRASGGEALWLSGSKIDFGHTTCGHIHYNISVSAFDLVHTHMAKAQTSFDNFRLDWSAESTVVDVVYTSYFDGLLW